MIYATSRNFTLPEQSKALKNLLQSILGAELLSPSRTLWLSSAWVSDIKILDNSSRQFQAVCPQWEARKIRLSECLDGICARGGKVVLILRDVDHNREFIAAVQSGSGWNQGKIGLVLTQYQHVKAMVSERFVLDGSMNFTFNGIKVNDERLTYRCSTKDVQEELVNLEGRWEGNIRWGDQ